MTIKVTYNVTDVYMSQSVSPVYINVSYSDGGASGGGVWGSITGTLSNQTDLQTALDLKVPYSGATGNVDLGEYELKAGQVEFDQTPTGTAGVGVMRWNDADGTVDLGLKGGNVTLQVGQEQVARVVNKTGANLLESEYKVVKVSSAQGQRLAVDLAQANNDNNSADTLGIVTENISNNQEGFITTMGTVRGINTTGSLQGETWTDGDVLYLSGTTAGAITNVKPTAPLHIVVVGYVEYAHQNNGKIFVKVMNGWEIDELHNVLISSPTNNQGLIYNSSNSLWENKSITTALGYTPVPTTRNITINGVTYDLSADRTWNISTGISGSGASGQITYWTGASAVSGSNNLFWDNANGRLGIGTNTPAVTLDIFGNTNFKSANANNATLSVTTNTLGAILSVTGGSLNTRLLYLSPASGETRLFTSGVNSKLASYDGAGSVIYELNTSGQSYFLNNVHIGGSTNPAVKFQVTGDTLLRGSGNTSATTALTVQNSSSVQSLSINNAGQAMFGTNTQSSGVKLETDGVFRAWTNVQIGQFGAVTINTTQLTKNASGSDLFEIANTSAHNAISGTYYALQVRNSVTPTSGNAQVNGLVLNLTINQTGGANGITRGLYVNPTLTAAADFRAIETSAGNVLFGSNFFWDNANGRLGIGTNAPSTTLDIRGKTRIQASGNCELDFVDGVHIFRVAQGSGGGYVGTLTSQPLIFATGALERGRFTTNGNLMLGTTSDLGVRLGVVGDTLLRGSGATSATTALTVQNSSSTNLFTVRNDGLATITNITTTETQIQVGGASGGIGSFTTPAIKFGNTVTGIYTDNNRVFFVSNGTFGGGFASGYYQGNHVWISAAANSNDLNTPKLGAYRLNAEGLAAGLAGNSAGDVSLATNTLGRLVAKYTGQIRFVPLASAPAGAQAGDVYYDSTLNKLRVYTTAWETITSI